MEERRGTLAVETRELGKRYRLGSTVPDAYSTLRDAVAARFSRRKPADRGEEFWALRGVSLAVPDGQVLGIVGANGAGKSTLLKILSRITSPTEGEVALKGRVASLLEVGTGFHPELNGRENIFLNGVILGMKRREVAEKLDQIVEFAGVERFLDTPVKRYSSGMYLRLAFSVAAHLEPEILIVDEVLAVGDAQFQQRCLGKMEEEARSGRTILFVSHNMAAVRQLCDRAILLKAGRILLDGRPADVVHAHLQSGLGEGNSKTWDNDDAPGKEGIHLRGLSVAGADGGGNEVRSDGPIEIELTVAIEEVLSGLVIGFDILTLEGLVVLRSCLTDGPREEWPDYQPGVHRYVCTIPAGLLNSGSFLVAPKAWIKDTRWIFSAPASLRFSVSLAHGSSPYWLRLGPDEKPGVIAPILEWRRK